MNIEAILKIIKLTDAASPEDKTLAAEQLKALAAGLEEKGKEAVDTSKQMRDEVSKELETLLTVVGAATEALSKNYKETSAVFLEQQKELALLREEQEKLANSTEKLTEAQQAELDELNNQIDAYEELLKVKKQELTMTKANQNVLSGTVNYLERLLGLNKEMTDSFLGSMIAGDKSFAAIRTAVSQALEPTRLLASALAQVQKATLQFATQTDNSRSKLAMQTASTGEYNSMMVQLNRENGRSNLTLQKSQEAISGLNTEVSMFNQLSPAMQKELADTSGKLSALGVQGTLAGTSFDVLINGLEMSIPAAQEAQMELLALGTAFGKPANVILTEFNQAAQELAKYGDDMVDVFGALQGAAEATGVKFDQLMSISKQFDTFEGAATHAGKLNAILGGGVINSMDLLNAKEEERIRLLIQSMAMSGKNWGNLNRFERQAIKAAAGIQSMAEANKIFSQSLSAYDMQVEKAKEAEAANAKLAERTEAAVSVAEKLKRIGEAFAISMNPLITVIGAIADKLLLLNDMLNGWLFPTLTALGTMGYLGYKAFILFGAGADKAGKSVGKGLAVAIKKTSRAIGVGMKTISNSIAASTPQIVGSISAVSKAMGVAAPAVLKFGLAFAAIAIPIALVAFGLAAVIQAVAHLIKELVMLVSDTGVGLFKLGLDFIGFAYAFSVGIQVLGIGVIAFIATLSVAAMMIVLMLPVFAVAFGAIAVMIAGIALALALLPEKKLISLSMATEGVAKMIDAAVELTPAAVEHTKEIVSSAADYVTVQAQMRLPDQDAFVQAIRGAMGGAGGGGGGQDIVLVMNDREFARAVNVSINRTNNLSID